MPHPIRSLSAVALLSGGGLLAACPSSGPAPASPVASTSAPAPIDVVPPAPTTSASASDAPSASPSTATVPVPGKAVKAPIFSADSCNKDEECAPVAQCHSNQCVALANAGTMKPGMLCTMDCRGGTIDCGFNHCGCAEAPSGGKKCALLPGSKP